MKISYNRQLRKYVVSQLGAVIDSSTNLDELLTRHGFTEDSNEPFSEVKGDDYDADIDQLFGNLEVN